MKYIIMLWFQDAKFEMLYFELNYPNSFFAFGYPRQAGSYKSWIVQFRDAHGKKELWGANRWIHLCLAYEKSTGFVKIVRVKQIKTLN